MTKTYTKLDDENLAVVETIEQKQIVNKKSLEEQRKALVEQHTQQLADIDEALAEFTSE